MGTSALNSALSGLRIAQQQINNVSNNISNVGTPGYTRKILPQSTQVLGGVSAGVLAENIIRNVDANVQKSLWTQVSSVGQLSIKENYLSRIEQLHGPPDRELSVAAELARLRDSFGALAVSPEDGFLLGNAVNEAIDAADKINDLAALLNTSRNDVQSELEQTIDSINGFLDQIAAINNQIGPATGSGQSTAQLEDARDQAVQGLAELIDITYFTRGDGVLVVQTNIGAELVSNTTTPLSYQGGPISASSYYPDTINGIFLQPPTSNINPIDLTTLSPGGKLGGLIELRDVTFPKQLAQIDELSYRLALRFEAQGLRLFTNAAGVVPADTPPDPTTVPPTSVTYVGFASEIRVNSAIIDDNSLIQKGTTDSSSTVQPGSSEVLTRVIEFAFGSVDFQQAIGGIDLRTSLQAAPNDTLQNWLGLTSENRVSGSVDLTAYAGVADILAAGGEDVFGVAVTSETDRFSITFDDPDVPGGPLTIDIDLRTVAASGVNAAQDLVNAITADPNWAPAVAAFGTSVSIGTDGQLVFESRSNVQIGAAGAEPMSDLGFAFLGLNPGTYEASDPYFEVAVGSNTPTRIIIEPGDDETDLLAKLQAVPGLAVEDITISADGFLRLRPGEDYTNPEYGGGVTVTGGPFTASNAGINAIIGAGTVPDGINIASALFGSFSAGPPATDVSPITDVLYGSETDASLAPPIPTVGFRTEFLGPGADIQTNLIGSTALIDFSQRLVNENVQELLQVQRRVADEDTLRNLLQTQLSNESGVNIDEELANLIVIQMAYAASARVISSIQETFDVLLRAV